MGFFTSKKERQVKRDMDIRKGIQMLRSNLKKLDKSLKDYRIKAVRANQLGADDQVRVLKEAISRTLSQQRMQDRQLLAIETAQQTKSWAESTQQFSQAMSAISKSMASSFGSRDLNELTRNYQSAIGQAKEVEERMGLFLDMSSDAMSTDSLDQDLVTSDEIDRLMDEDLQMAEARNLDDRIDSAINPTEKALY